MNKKHAEGVLRALIEKNRTIESQLQVICNPLLSSFQLHYFYYSRYYFDGRVSLLCTHTNIVEVLWDKGLFTTENKLFKNIVRNLEANKSAYFLWTNEPPDELHKFLFENNIWHGLTTYTRQEKFIEVWGFGTAKDNDKIIDCYVNQLNYFKRFLFYFRSKARPLIDKVTTRELKHIFSVNDMADNITAKDITASFLEKTACSRFYFDDDRYITEQESKCVYYLSKGKSLKEIAKILEISPRTVETYINNIKVRLSLDSKADLVDLFLKHEMDSLLI